MCALLLLLACDGDPADGKPDSGRETGEADTGETGATDDTGDTDSAAPIDADGDGFFAGDEAGNDCDDTDATTYPGAPERCDATDHDCDGEPLTEGVCGEEQALDVVQEGWIAGDPWTGWASHPVSVGNLGGDGSDELAAFTAYSPDGTTGYWAVAILSWPFPRDGEAIAEAADRYVLNAGGVNFFYEGLVPAGDFNGDGWDDLFLVSSGAYTRSVAALVPGPFDAWPEAASFEDLAFAQWEIPEQNTNFGIDADAGGDFNGDGLTDAAVVCGHVDGCSEGTILLFAGREDAAGDADVQAETALVSSEGMADMVSFLGDQDGDGVDDVFWSNGYAFWTSGADIPVGAPSDWSGYSHKYTVAGWEGEGDPYCGKNGLSGFFLPRLGDWTGDGLEDAAAYCEGPPGVDSGQGRLYLLDGAAFASGATTSLFESAVGSWDLDTNDTRGSEPSAIGDVDGDGRGDLGLTEVREYEFEDPSGYADTRVDIVPSSWGVPTGVRSVEGYLRLRPREDTDAHYFMWPGVAGDFDGDGFTELPLYEYDEPYPSDHTSLHFALGWDVPWDDPTYW